MGLLALSAGESSEMQRLLESRSKNARFAVSYFCRQVRAAIGALAAKAGGIDVLVLSGGIGEHAPQVWEDICGPLGFLGFVLNVEANQSNSIQINATDFKPVLSIAADEEDVIRGLVQTLLRGMPADNSMIQFIEF